MEGIEIRGIQDMLCREVQRCSMDGTERVEPPSWYYSFAGLFLAIGLGLTVYSIVSGTRHIRENIVRMDVPGQMDMELKRATYTVFIEYNAAEAAKSPWSVNCSVYTLPAGQLIKNNSHTGSLQYNYGARNGIALMEFDAPHDGMYMLACQTTGDTSAFNMDAAIGGGTSKGVQVMVVRSLLAFIAGVTVAALIFLKVTMLRLKSRNEIRERGLKPV
jgi:hypothetical protein